MSRLMNQRGKTHPDSSEGIEIIGTDPRDGIQGSKIAIGNESACAKIMLDKGVKYVLECVEAGIRTFDIGSIVDQKLVPTTSNLKEWLTAAKEAVKEQFGQEIRDELDFQLLILNDDNDHHDFLDRAMVLHKAGVLDSLAYLHSHDHKFLGENQIRRIDGKRIFPRMEDMDPTLPEDKKREAFELEKEKAFKDKNKEIIRESRRRYVSLKNFAEELGVPLNVYISNATGTRNKEGEPVPASSTEVIAELTELLKLGLRPGSRIIISDTEAVGTSETIQELMAKIVELTTDTTNEIEAETKVILSQSIGIHPHVEKSKKTEEIIELIKAFIEPIRGKIKKIFVECGLGGFGGCIILKDPSQNIPYEPVLAAIEKTEGIELSHRLKTDNLDVAGNIAREWKAALKPLATAPKF